MKLRHVSAVAVLALILPFAASALTADDLKQQIQSLLAQIAQLQQQLKQIQTPVPVQPPPDDSRMRPICPTFTRTLAQGTTGDDVIQLQQYLGVESTGYFGPATAKAIAAVQADAGLEQVGIVGPQTRAWIYKRCGGGWWNQNFSASPTSGQAPLEVNFDVRGISTGSTKGYTIDFGDGTSGSLSVIGQRECFAAPCESNMYGARHTYTSNGSYIAKLIYQPSFYCPPGAMCPQMMPAPQTIGTVTIYVGGTTGTGAPVVTGVGGPASLAVGQTGTWTVHASVSNNTSTNTNLRYSVIWGDENINDQLNTLAGNVPQLIRVSGSFTHAYQSAGSYRPTFTVANDAGSAQTSASVVVGGGNICPVYQQPLCPAGYHVGPSTTNANGCSVPGQCVPDTTTSGNFSASPLSGAAPLNVNFSYPFNSSTQNGSYMVNFGDGTSGQMSPLLTMQACMQGSDCSQRGSWNANHTYTSAGTYTAALSNVGISCGEWDANCIAQNSIHVIGTVTIAVYGYAGDCWGGGCSVTLPPSLYPNVTGSQSDSGTAYPNTATADQSTGTTQTPAPAGSCVYNGQTYANGTVMSTGVTIGTCANLVSGCTTSLTYLVCQDGHSVVTLSPPSR